MTIKRWAAVIAALLCASGIAASVSLGAVKAPRSTRVTAHAASGSIVIGATIPLTGALSAFGHQEQIGDNLAVAQINAGGGVTIGGKKYKVTVQYLDNQSLPNLVTTQVHTLVLQDHAIGLFGTPSPPLIIPLSLAADQLKVPVVHNNPVEAWLSGSKTATRTPGTRSSTRRSRRPSSSRPPMR